MTTATPKPKKPKDLMSRIPAGFVRAVLRGHSSLGLAFAALIYLVCLSGTYLAASGVNIWLARRDKGRPAPGWERAWTATVWGQPAGIAAAAVAALVAGTIVPTIATWLIVSLAFLLAAIRLPAEKLSAVGSVTTGALILLAAATHLALRGGIAAADGMAWIVNAALIAGGLFLILWARRRSGGAAKPAPVAVAA